MEIKVVDVRRVGDRGKVKAYADVEFGGVMLVKGFTIVKSGRGLCVTGPRKADNRDYWFDIVIFNPEFWDRLEPLILDAYDALA